MKLHQRVSELEPLADLLKVTAVSDVVHVSCGFLFACLSYHMTKMTID